MANKGLLREYSEKHDLGIARALTWRYVIALALVASLSTAAWFSLHLVISEQENTAAVVNVSGRQRMLSQRTALFSNLLITAPRAERPRVRSELEKALALMARSHQGLIHGDTEMGLPASMSPAVYSLYFEGPNPLDEQVNTYIKAVQALLMTDDDALSPDNHLLAYITQTAPTTLVSALDKMVSQYQLEGETSVRRLEKAETIFWLVTLWLLMLEAALIFHPFIKHVRVVIAKLQRVTDELRLHQDHLDEMILQRTEQLETRGKELAESEEKFRLISTAAQDAIAIIGTDEQVIYWNPAAEKIFDYSAEEVLGKNLHDLLTPASQLDAAHRGFKEFRISGEGNFIGKTFEISALRKSGEEFPVELSISAFKLHDSWHALGIIRDISARRKAEEKLRLAASVFTYAREGIMITAADGTILDINDTFSRITGFKRDEVLGKNPSILSSGRQPPDFYAAMWQSLAENGYWYGEIWNRRKNGEVYAEMLTISAVRDNAGITQNYVALFTDITPMKEHQQQLEYIAHYDPLTALPNRVLLADRMRQAMSQSRRRNTSLAVGYLDLDGFKAVNDAHGHGAGDDLLMAISRRMETALREGDTLARIGGDEFVVVLVDLENLQDCKPVLERLLLAASDPVTVGDAVLQVSASIGVTTYPQDNADAEQLMRHADQSMYQAKQAGKNRYHFFDTNQDAVVRALRESLENFRRALDHQEFMLYYQPKVNMKTGTIIGAEALIRWQHPDLGLLQPAAFLPVIEGQPICVELGEWVIATALEQMSEWQSAGLDIPVSVNVSASQLQQADFVSRLSAQLAAHPDVQPHSLELEILETSALEDTIQVSEFIRACHEIGISFSLDDFGTGYSSLTYLKSLPAKQLKIDRSFVLGMLDDPDDLAIVDSIIGLSTAFSRQVIAEGVESVAHGELLLSLGCELAQGYGIARPMPAAEMPAWVKAWQPDATWTAWRERIHNPDDMAVVYAEVEHRRWLRTLKSFLSGECDTLPPMDEHQCRFGLWQATRGRLRYGNHPDFSALAAVHERIHVLSRELVDSCLQGRRAEAFAREGELHALRDELIARLRRLVSNGPPPS